MCVKMEQQFSVPLSKTIYRHCLYVVEILLLCVIYFSTAKLGLSLYAVGRFATLVWLPSGIAVAALFLFGPRLWPGLLIGAFLANLSHGAPFLIAVAIGIGNTLEALTCTFLLKRQRFRPTFNHLRGILFLILLAIPLSSLISATIGVSSLWLGKVIAFSSYVPTWSAWWIGDMVSILIVTSFLLVWSTWPHGKVSGKCVAEMGGFSFCLLVVGLMVFLGFHPAYYEIHPGTYMVFPPLIWAALRFGPRVTLTAILTISILAILGTIQGVFAVSIGNPSERLLFLQIFMGILASTSMILAAVMAERRELERDRAVMAQRSIQEHQQRLELARQAGNIGTFEWDLRHDHMLWTARLEGLYGLAPGTFEGTLEPWIERIYPDDRPCVSAALQTTIMGGASFAQTFRVVWPDQSIHHLSSEAVVVREPSGEPLHMIGVALDVTEHHHLQEREQAARAVAETRLELLQLILDELPSSVCLLQGEEARLVLANRATTTIWGATWNIGQPMQDFLSINHISVFTSNGLVLLPATLMAFRALQHDETVREQQVSIRRGNGTTLPALMSTIALGKQPDLSVKATGENSGDHLSGTAEPAVLVVYQDVTERVELEQRKDEFIAMASHELKTPLTSMKVYAQSLRRRLLKQEDEVAVRMLTKVDTQLNALTRLINDLLDVTKMTLGTLSWQEELFDLGELIQEIVDHYRHITVSHQICLEGAGPIQICADRERIGQVLTNVLSNAIKYSPQGGLILVKQIIEKDKVMVSVRDNGIGIPPEKQVSVFERFYRVKDEMHETFPGLGLGLYLSAQIIKRQGGQIWLESQVGAGSTFFFTLLVTPQRENITGVCNKGLIHMDAKPH